MDTILQEMNDLIKGENDAGNITKEEMKLLMKSIEDLKLGGDVGFIDLPRDLNKILASKNKKDADSDSEIMKIQNFSMIFSKLRAFHYMNYPGVFCYIHGLKLVVDSALIDGVLNNEEWLLFSNPLQMMMYNGIFIHPQYFFTLLKRVDERVDYDVEKKHIFFASVFFFINMIQQYWIQQYWIQQYWIQQYWIQQYWIQQYY
jgi:hypothetical protein